MIDKNVKSGEYERAKHCLSTKELEIAIQFQGKLLDELDKRMTIEQSKLAGLREALDERK